MEPGTDRPCRQDLVRIYRPEIRLPTVDQVRTRSSIGRAIERGRLAAAEIARRPGTLVALGYEASGMPLLDLWPALFASVERVEHRRHLGATGDQRHRVRIAWTRFDEIGRELTLYSCGERIRQIYCRALCKVRHQRRLTWSRAPRGLPGHSAGATHPRVRKLQGGAGAATRRRGVEGERSALPAAVLNGWLDRSPGVRLSPAASHRADA